MAKTPIGTFIKATDSLHKELCDQPWFISIGCNPDYELTGSSALYVYTTNVRKARTVVPQIYKGFPVAIKKMGRPRPASVTDSADVFGNW